MDFIERHKAALITFLITGIILFSMFSFHITKQNELIAESYYEVEPLTPEELQKLEELEALEKALKTTNIAANEDEEFKEMMKNFKSMSSNDFENTTKELQEDASQEKNDVLTSESSYNTSSGSSVNQEELNKFKKAKDILAMRSPEKREENTKPNAVSTLTYSLKGRTLLDFDTPRYLCEDSGKIVVNITVNADGYVTNAYINNSSTSNNECLTEHALDYAKSVQFDSGTSASQLGSITFHFKGKY
ncbi:TonB family protein [Flavobacteriaceae bacterium MAR_2010_72]|nr:TonB family protein [Flavobacteriaceae bacterium MAR_2010_72]TVZ58039.1 TonB family protein [Flavobacteriaceae bacterium MAR_2010_105]